MGSTDRCSVAPGRSASAGMDTRACCPADAACRGRCAGGEVDPARDGRLEIPRDHPLGSVEARNFDVGDGGATRTTRRFRIRPHCRHKHRVRPDPRRRSSLGRRRARTRRQRHQHATLARVSQHRRRAHVERTTGGLGRRRRHRSSLGQRSRSVRTPPPSVRIRDGNGVVGPLVLPGQSSCLRCADIIRSELDPHWLHLSAQLLGSAGHAESAMIHASVALALAEIDAALSALDLPSVVDLPSAASAASLSSTLEIALRPYRITTRRWPRQISCSCQYLAPVSGKGRPSQT